MASPPFNRMIWEADDPHERQAGAASDLCQPIQRFLRQIGLDGRQWPRFIEIGCWGTMINALRAKHASQQSRQGGRP